LVPFCVTKFEITNLKFENRLFMTLKKMYFRSLVFTAFILFSASCARKVVTRIDPNQQVDLSGRWNDTDSKLTAEAMMKDVLSRPWLTNFTKAKGKQPVVIVGIMSV
jgi:hypothetical protein